jgi:RHH-type proline utilization regulon transcriptional repressor/proline dehydrogenase/delta 1-pyrroline-5-carboxylate dehydrogenase
MGIIPLYVQTDEDLAGQVPGAGRIRYAAPDRVPEGLHRAAAASGSYVAREPVLMEGRLELLHYLREQSLSHSYHRYGNLGERERMV